MSADDDASDPLSLNINRYSPEVLKEELVDVYQEAYAEYPQYAYTSYGEILDYFQWLKERSPLEDGFLVASDSKEVLGFAVTDPFWEIEEQKAGEVLELVVSPRAQGFGLGKKLLDLSINSIRQHDREIVGLEVGRFNYKAQSLYRHFGFNFFERDEEWYRMIKNCGNEENNSVALEMAGHSGSSEDSNSVLV